MVSVGTMETWASCGLTRSLQPFSVASSVELFVAERDVRPNLVVVSLLVIWEKSRTLKELHAVLSASLKGSRLIWYDSEKFY